MIKNDITLATKYRPQTFEDVCAQQNTIQILKQQIAQNKSVNCYLFYGPAGTGKTTMARLLSDEWNDHKGHPIEIDAASNNSAESIRQLIVQARQRSFDSKYKVYIMDECHLLSSQAWAVFLKLLEEPPEFTKFIFCTTNPEKVPEAIMTRLQTFVLSKVPNDLIIKRLEYICNAERDSLFEGKDPAMFGDPPDYDYDIEALEYIARLANGSMRQAIAYLEKCIALSSVITLENVCKALGTGDYELMSKFIKAIIEYDTDTAISLIENVYNSGKDPKAFIKNCLNYILDLNKVAINSNNRQYTVLPESEFVDQLLTYKDSFLWFLEVMSKLYEAIKYDTMPITLIEISIMKWCKP